MNIETDKVASLYLKAAEKILSQSLKVRKGDSITIETWSNWIPFARQVVIAARNMGAIPLLLVEDEEAFMKGFKTMDKDVLGKMGKNEYGALSGTDAYVFIPGPPVGMFSRLSSEDRATAISYNDSWYESATKAKLKGVRLTFGQSGSDVAKILGKSIDQIISHQMKATLNSDFESISRTGRKIATELHPGAFCVITSSGRHKLEFEVKGEAEVEDAIIGEEDLAKGHMMTYVPPGFVSLHFPQVSGKVQVYSPATLLGSIKDAVLEFESGKLVGWESVGSQERLNKLVKSIPENDRRVTRVSIGLNPEARYGFGMDRFVGGGITLNISYRFTSIVRNVSLSADGTQIIRNGKLTL